MCQTRTETSQDENEAITFAALVALTAHQTEATENAPSFGAGIWALYSGIGVNAALRSENDFKYVAAGCTGIGYSTNSGWILPCGVAAGWLWTGLLSSTSNRHGLGLYAGPVGINKGRNKNDDKARCGLGVTYIYFSNGSNTKGWNLGITPALGQENGKTKGGLLLNAGYPF